MILDMAIFPLVMHGGGHSSMSSTLRLLRMARILRVIRLFKMFNMLAIILSAFIKAISTVMWVRMLTCIIDYVCAILCTQMIGHNAHMWGDDAQEIELWFGTIVKSMQSLFVIMTLAEWDTMVAKLATVIPR